MTDALTVTLPRGLFDSEGGRHRDAVLTPVTGHVEAGLAEARELDPASVSRLLAGAIARIGGYEPILPAHAAALSRGDRELVLLHLRRALFGDRLALVVACPNPGCRQEADLALTIAQLCPAADRAADETFAVDTPAGTATLREPTGGDDDAVHGLDRDTASAALWSRLVVDLAGHGPITAAQWTELDLPTRHALALALADAHSGPTLAFVAPCPSCRAWMEIELDPAVLLAAELGVAGDRLFAEVHTLAYFYHWSEHEILSLPRQRRWRYLELVHRQVAGAKAEGMR